MELLAGVAGWPEVIGDVAGERLVLEGLRLEPAAQGPWPVAVAGQGRVEALAVVSSPGLEFLLRALGLTPQARPEGRVWLGQGGGTGEETEVVRRVMAAWAEDAKALQGKAAPEALARRLVPMLVRTSSRLRAEATAAPHDLRRAAGPGDVACAAWRQPYAHFFAMEEHDLSWRRFDATMSEVATRAVFLSGDAVTVLPYDPVRDRVLVVEQFRAGPYARGDAGVWQIEAVAGRVDPFETPEEAARREAVEEAGLTLTDLEFVGRYYPSPGAVSEYLYSYVALTDLPDDAAGVFGVAEEVEDIRGHLVGFDALMGLVTSGEVDNAPLLITALWLQRERGRLRSER